MLPGNGGEAFGLVCLGLFAANTVSAVGTARDELQEADEPA